VKYKSLLTTTIIFFLLVNTTYYWEGKLGYFAMPATLILLSVYLGLLIALFRHLFFAIKEKFKDRQRLFVMAVLTTVLALTFFKPFGLIDFDKLEGDNILVAQGKGAANCMTTFKLKENNKFTERSVCFGVKETKGNYKLTNDTIYFENVEPGRHEDEFYKFAIIRPSKFDEDGKHFDLVRYKSLNDTTGHALSITKNELYDSTDKKPSR
jgi:hypothetical protein